MEEIDFKRKIKIILAHFLQLTRLDVAQFFSFITISKQIIFLSKNLALLSYNNKSISKELKNHGSFLAL